MSQTSRSAGTVEEQETVSSGTVEEAERVEEERKDDDTVDLDDKLLTRKFLVELLDPVKADLKVLKKEAEENKKNMHRINSRLGRVMEISTRGLVKEMFGADFAKPVLIRSLQEVVRLVMKTPARHSRSYEKSLRLCALLQEQLMDAVELVVRDLAKSVEKKYSWSTCNGIDWEKFQQNKQQLKHIRNARVYGCNLGASDASALAQRIGYYIGAEFDRKPGRFFNCKGPGLVIANLFVNKQYITELEIDYRGSVTIVNDEIVQVSIGEGKSQDISSAKVQLKKRLLLLGWAAKVLHKRHTVALIGHCFSMTQSTAPAEADGDISYYFHFVK